MANTRTFPPCIHCGAMKTSDGTPTSVRQMIGYANDGEIPLYYLKCTVCEKHYMAALIPLPAHASLSALDEELRKHLREKKRKKFGYDGQTKFVTRGAKRHESDRLLIDVKVIPGRISSGLTRKLGVGNRQKRWANVQHVIS